MVRICPRGHYFFIQGSTLGSYSRFSLVSISIPMPTPRLSLRGRAFAFHGFSRSTREQWERVLVTRGATIVPKWTVHSGALVVLTNAWVDFVPTGRDILSVTEYWLRESLQRGEWLDPDSNRFFKPPPRTTSYKLSFPMEYDPTLQNRGHWRVLLPCSPQNVIEEVVPLWPYIVSYLQQQTTATTRELIALLQWCTGESRYPLNCLEMAINELMDVGDRTAFFTTVLPNMKRLVLELPFRFQKAPRLLTPIDTASLSASSKTTLHTNVVEMTRLETLSLLCAMFFSVFPAQEHVSSVDFPWFNMSEMFSAPRSMQDFVALKAHKIRTILEYFLRIIPRFLQSSSELDIEVITFTRVAAQIPTIDFSSDTTSLIKTLAVSPTLGRGIGRMSPVSRESKLIEDLRLHLQIDFANKYAGGGVMNGGAVQEEIRFILSPELMVACLVFAKLEPHESFVIQGSERFSNYTGYGGTFRFAGSVQDTTPYQDLTGTVNCQRRRRQNVVVGIDAISFSGNNVDRQYSRSCIMRDLVKALVGFAYPDPETTSWPVATGNWGCGVFRGDPELKFLIQWFAATLTRRDLVYVIFDNSDNLHAKIDKLMGACQCAFRLNYVDSSLLPSWILEFLLQLESVSSLGRRHLSGSRGAKQGRREPEKTVLELAAEFVREKADAMIQTVICRRNAPKESSTVQFPAPNPADLSTNTTRHRTSHQVNFGAGGPSMKQARITDLWKPSK